MKPVSTIIESHIPRFIRMEYPNFVTFIKAYYEWAEQKGQAYEFISGMPDYMDVDRTSLELLEHFAAVYLSPLPDIIYSKNNLRTLVKNITQHYSAKGSEGSYKFLFRLIENKDVEFYYPSEDMLRISDGKWSLFKSIKIENPPIDIMGWESSEIIGSISNGRAVIDFIKQYKLSDGRSIAELFLVEIDPMYPINRLMADEVFTGTTWGGVKFSGTIIPVFAGVRIVDTGKYNRVGTRMMPESASGVDASVVVDYVSKGQVEGISILNGGLDYKVNDAIKFVAAGFGSGAYGRVSAVDISGTITAVQLIFGGHDYTDMSSVTIESSIGHDAILMAESISIGHISHTNIRDFGAFYSPGDLITMPLMARIYNQFMPIDIGEIIDGPSGAGIVLGHDKIGDVMTIQVITGQFDPGDTIMGRRHSGVATIYDISQSIIEYQYGGVCNYKGRYINRDGHISSDKFIQDSYFYQVFSYMIKTFQKRSEWVDYVAPVHPSGTISFGFREVPNRQLLNEGYGGFYGPTLDMTELYRFKWIDGNTLIKQYADVIIDDVANINTKDKNKTNHCFGSEITIS